MSDFTVHLGPLRGASAFPVIEEGADYVPGAGWEEVTDAVTGLACSFAEREHRLVVSLAGWARDSDTWTDDRQIIVRGRWYDAAGVLSAYRVIFAGYLSGEGQGESAGTEHGPRHRGDVTAVQEWSYLDRTRLPALSLGRIDLATGTSATASSTLTDPSAESGLEYLGSPAVSADQAVDGNRDTVWVSNVVADPAPATFPLTGKKVVFQELYNGRGSAGTLGANGRSLWLELWCADVQHSGFELDTQGYAPLKGATLTRTTAWASEGSWSVLVSGPAGGGIERPYTGFTGGVEVAVTFSLRAQGGTAVDVRVIIQGAGSHTISTVAAPAGQHRRYTLRHPANGNGQLWVRFELVDGPFYVDDVRASGGVRLSEDVQPYKRLWLAWEDGNGNSGAADLVRELGLSAVGGDTSIILVDDRDLFQQAFDAGDGATVTQIREVPGLGGLDFSMVSGAQRGRLRLAYYRRWPDLPGTGGVLWDDVTLATEPAASATQSLVRIDADASANPPPTTFGVRTNPAPGGAETTGSSWLNIDLGDYPATALTASVGTGASVTVTVESTAGYPAYGWAYLTNERVWLQKTGPTTFTGSQRVSPVSHSAGELVYPEVTYRTTAGSLVSEKATVPLVAAIRLARRPGTPVIRDYDLIGSVLPSPGDPSVSQQWGAHPDWFPLARARNNLASEPVWLLQRYKGGVATAWPPDTSYAAGWGRPVRHLRVVIMRMAPGPDGTAQRAKLNELNAYAAALDSDESGEYAGTQPPDLRGVVGHLLVQQAGIPMARVRVDRGRDDGIAWGAAYGELQLAPSSVAEALLDIERRGLVQVTVGPTNLVHVRPDPLSGSAAYPVIAYTWDGAVLWRLNHQRAAAHAVAQARVSGRNGATSAVYQAAYPRTPLPLGRIEDVSDLILGSQQHALETAARAFRRGNVRLQLTTASDHAPLRAGALVPYSRQLVNYAGGDAAAVDFAGMTALLTSYDWTVRVTEHGPVWTSSGSLQEGPW